MSSSRSWGAVRWSAVWLLLTLTTVGCSTSSPVTPAGAASTDQVRELPPYRIGIPDLLNVKVWEQPELSGEVLVRRDGMVSMPLIGDVQANGLTPEQLADAIAQALRRYVAEPSVSVAVIEMRSQVVSVIGGGVQRSGVVELRHDMRIVDAIAEMGGLTPFARRRDIRVLRNTPDGERVYRFDYTAFIRGSKPESNFLLAAGDTIIVPD